MCLPFTTSDQTDRFLRRRYGHYRNRAQNETSVLSKYNQAGKRNCKLERKHCGLCAGRPDTVTLARTRRTPSSQFLSFGKTKRASDGVIFIDTLAYRDYLPSVMDEWIWATGEMILREGRPKCAERNLSQCYFVHHKSQWAAGDHTRVSAGRGLRPSA